MIAFCLISIVVLSVLAVYMAVKEQRAVELYCEQLLNINNFASKIEQASDSQGFVEIYKKCKKKLAHILH